MKEYFMILMLAGTMFFVSGCGDGSCYTFDGGCISLRNVKVLSSGIETPNYGRGGAWIKNGGITSETIKKLQSNELCRAYISFDDFKVYLGDNKELWLSEYQRVEKQFKSLQTQ